MIIVSSIPPSIDFRKNFANPASFGYSLALIPIGGSDTQFYSIESRKPVGFDKGEIPGYGILINKIDITDLSNPNNEIAEVVDRTIDLNPNDAGAVWTPLETFRDSTNNISIKVIRGTSSGFWVLIQLTESRDHMGECSVETFRGCHFHNINSLTHIP